MTPVEPAALHDGAKLVVFAKNQPEYIPLPASVSADGLVMTEWEMTDPELDALLSGGRLQIWLHTFNRPLQPISVKVTEPECGSRSAP